MNDAPRRVRSAVALLVMTALLASSIQAATSFGNHGTQVKDTDGDYAVHYETLSALGFTATGNVCRVNDGSGVTTADYYLHWGACTGAVSRGDIRLTATGGGAAGTVVKSSDSDKDISFDASVGAFLSGVGYLEADGIHGYSPGDFLYYSTDATLDATSGDIRLSTGSTNGVSTTAGTIISTSSLTDVTEAGDSDGVFPESTGLLDQGDFELRVHDADGDGTYDEDSDRLYLTPSSAVTGGSAITSWPRIGDLHLSNADGQTFGSRVTSSSSDYTYQLRSVDPSLVTTNAVSSPLNSRHLFMHFSDVDGTNDDVWQNDVTIKGGSSYGTRVTTSASGHGEVIDTTVSSFATQLFWLDVDGNDAYTPGSDPVYLNRPTSLGGPSDTLALTAGDVRITAAPTGSFAAGTVVSGGDADLAAYSGVTGNDGTTTGKWFVLLHDIDGSDAVGLTTLSNGRVTGNGGTWDSAVDGAYIAAGSTLADGDVRLVATPFLGNTILECDDTAPDHTDCDLAISDDGEFSTTGSAITTWTASTGVYHDTDGDGFVDAGETRIYHTSLAPGAVVGGDEDEGVQVFANTKVSILSTDAPFTDFAVGATGPDVYWDADDDGTVSTSDLRLYHDWTPPGNPGDALVCNSAPKDKDCGASVTADSNIRVTGDDGTRTAAKSEYVYYSKDALVNDGDRRFLAVGSLNAATNVAWGNADVTRTAPTSGDQVYLSWCAGDPSTTCASHPTSRLTVGDIQLISGAGTRVTDSTAGHDVTLTAVATGTSSPYPQAILQYDLGGSGSTIDDGFYLSFGTTGSVKSDDIRLVPVNLGSTKAAGTYITSSDSSETGVTLVVAESRFTDAVKYVDIDSNGAYSSGDGVYLDVDNNGLETGDIRLTSVTTDGTAYAAGTFTLAGDKDVVGFSYASSQPSWTLYFFDEDRDGSVDDTDTVYVLPGSAVGSGSNLALDLLAVRVGGGGGSTTGSGGTTTPPSGGTTTPPPDDTTTPPPADDDTNNETDDGDTPAEPISEEIVESANQALAESLRVSRREGTNHLSWDDVQGEAGYQVWRSDSPYVHVTDLAAGATEFADEDGGAKSQYIVTAYFENADGVRTGYAEGVDEDGNPDVPGKESLEPAKPKKESPGLPLVALLAALGVVVAVRRRRA